MEVRAGRLGEPLPKESKASDYYGWRQGWYLVLPSISNAMPVQISFVQLYLYSVANEVSLLLRIAPDYG